MFVYTIQYKNNKEKNNKEKKTWKTVNNIDHSIHGCISCLNAQSLLPPTDTEIVLRNVKLY